MNTPEGYRGVVFLMRGIPGSGKSTLAKQLGENFSADAIIENLPGGYAANWTIEKAGWAHALCRHKVKTAMQEGHTPLVVDNTNLKRKEVMPYVKFAIEYHYWINIIESTTPWWQEIKVLLEDKVKNELKLREWAEKLANGFEVNSQIIKNCHGVPAEGIWLMMNKYQPYTVDDLLSPSVEQVVAAVLGQVEVAAEVASVVT